MGQHVGNHHLQAQRRGAGLDDGNRLRVAVAGDDADMAFGFDAAPRQRHRLGRRSGFVEHGGVRHRHRSQVADHGLEVNQSLHAALADFGLVGRIGRVPGRVLQDVAQYHARRVGAVIALADPALEQHVALGQGLELCQGLGLTHGRGQLHRRGAPDAGGHDGVYQPIKRGLAHGVQHMRLVLGA